MNSTTRETLNNRLKALESHLGLEKIAGDSVLDKRMEFVARISAVHNKINHIYSNNPELQHVPDVMRRFQRPGGDKCLSAEPQESMNRAVGHSDHPVEAAGPQAETTPEELARQELVLIKLSKILSYCNCLLELLAMQIPVLTTDTCKELDPRVLLEKASKIKMLAREFDLLMAKHLILLEKYQAQAVTQARFWGDIQKRLRDATVATNAAMNARQMERKYL